MSSEFTQRQSGEDQRQAQQLSLQKSQPPATVPGYQLERFLGSGAYGEVWVGTDQNTGRQVAVKFYLHSSGVDWSLLSREVEKLTADLKRCEGKLSNPKFVDRAPTDVVEKERGRVEQITRDLEELRSRQQRIARLN